MKTFFNENKKGTKEKALEMLYSDEKGSARACSGRVSRGHSGEK